MKIYVLTDLEGVAGVARWDQTGCDTPGYPTAVRLLTAEVTACVAGIHDASPGAEIWVWDAHGPGGIDPERFPRGAKLLNNGPVPKTGFLDASFDALFLLGQHAMASTRDGNLAHSYSSKNIESIHINGLEVGEFGCRAAFAGELGVPTLFVSGDDKVAAEARALVPDIVAAEVKTGLGPQVALHMAPEDARTLIRAKAAEAVRRIPRVSPCRPIPQMAGQTKRFRQVIRIWGRTDPGFLLRRGFRQDGTRSFWIEADRLVDLYI